MVQLSLNQISIINLQRLLNPIFPLLIPNHQWLIQLCQSRRNQCCPLLVLQNLLWRDPLSTTFLLTPSTSLLYPCPQDVHPLRFFFLVFNGFRFLEGIRILTVFFWSTLCLGFSDDAHLWKIRGCYLKSVIQERRLSPSSRLFFWWGNNWSLDQKSQILAPGDEIQLSSAWQKMTARLGVANSSAAVLCVHLGAAVQEGYKKQMDKVQKRKISAKCFRKQTFLNEWNNCCT